MLIVLAVLLPVPSHSNVPRNTHRLLTELDTASVVVRRKTVCVHRTVYEERISRDNSGVLDGWERGDYRFGILICGE